jgi:hypothetical protein
MRFRTSTREFSGDTAVALVNAIRADAFVAGAARRPSQAFLGRWLLDLDSRVSRGADGEALALELLLLCQEYRLGVLVGTERGAVARGGYDA